MNHLSFYWPIWNKPWIWKFPLFSRSPTDSHCSSFIYTSHKITTISFLDNFFFVSNKREIPCFIISICIKLLFFWKLIKMNEQKKKFNCIPCHYFWNTEKKFQIEWNILGQIPSNTANFGYLKLLYFSFEFEPKW